MSKTTMDIRMSQFKKTKEKGKLRIRILEYFFFSNLKSLPFQSTFVFPIWKLHPFMNIIAFGLSLFVGAYLFYGATHH